MEESQIIRNVLAGNTNAFALLVQKYQDMAFSIAFRILGNNEDAEESVQDSFVKAYKSLSSFRGSSKFSTWFYQIVYNTSVTKIRNQFQSTSYEDYMQSSDADLLDESNGLLSLESSDRQEIIKKVLSNMPKDESLLLTLFYLEEFNVSEIVEITGFSESNVKVKLFRARKRFYELLTMYMKEEIKFLL